MVKQNLNSSLGSSLIRSNQTQEPIFRFDLKMLGRFDHRPFEPKSNPFLGLIQRCWAGLTMIKAKSNQAQTEPIFGFDSLLIGQFDYIKLNLTELILGSG
jgi:hypothetical protein